MQSAIRTTKVRLSTRRALSYIASLGLLEKPQLRHAGHEWHVLDHKPVSGGKWEFTLQRIEDVALA